MTRDNGLRSSLESLVSLLAPLVIILAIAAYAVMTDGTMARDRAQQEEERQAGIAARAVFDKQQEDWRAVQAAGRLDGRAEWNGEMVGDKGERGAGVEPRSR